MLMFLKTVSQNTYTLYLAYHVHNYGIRVWNS